METGQREAVHRASHFYGHPRGVDVSCVVTGNKEPHWHHLDEARPKWWSVLNIIPLDARLNGRLDKRYFRELPFELRPAILEARARDEFRRGHFAQGYACARLGACLMYPFRSDAALGLGLQPDLALSFCSFALLNLRPISAVPFAIDVLRRNVRHILRKPGEVHRASAARLVIEIGSYLRDYGLLTDALRCCDLADTLLEREPVGCELRARVGQHRAIALLGMGSQEATTVLDESEQVIQGAGLYIEGHANYLLWKARGLLNSPKPDPERCQSLLREVYASQKRERVSVWTYAEAVWTDAESQLVAGKSRAADALVALGRDLFESTGVVPTAILSPKCVARFREKYPRDLYVLPRESCALSQFVLTAQPILEVLELTSGWSDHL